METTVPMLAPDGSSGEIPADKVQAAMSAGFKRAVEMTSPDGKAGYIPEDKQSDAMKAGFKPTAAATEQPGFWENLGHTFGIGKEEAAAREQAFKEHPLKYAAESLAGPAYQLAKGAVGGVMRSTGELGQAVDELRGGNPASASVHAVTAVPIVGPALKKMSDEAPATTPGQSYLSRVASAATPGNVGTAPGTAAQVAPMALGAADAAMPGRAVIPNAPVAAAVKALPAKMLPSLFDNSPEGLITRAARPNKNNVGWEPDIKKALPLMKSAEAKIGAPITDIDGALDAAKLAKQDIWQQYEQRIGPAAMRGATIDGNSVADAMMNSIDKRTAVQNPALVAKIKAIADTYRRPMSLADAEDFIQSNNADLTTYYGKNKVSQQVAQADPTVSYQLAEGDALRSALYNKLDDLTGPGSAQLKKAYGALTNVQKELQGQKLVAARQSPMSLNEQFSTVRGIGEIAKSALNLKLGDAAQGVGDIATARWIKDRLSQDSMISRAFENTQPAQPFLLPRAMPRIAGQLPAQTGTVTPPFHSPMTPGERSAALMQQLRQRQQLRLPAKSAAIPLPPEF